MEHRTTDLLVEEFAAAVAEIAGARPRVVHEPRLGQPGYRPDAIVDVEHEGNAYRIVILDPTLPDSARQLIA